MDIPSPPPRGPEGLLPPAQPTWVPGPPRGGGEADKLSRENRSPHPTWLRKGTAALGYRQPPLGILRGRSYSKSESPYTQGPGFRHPALPLRRSGGMALRTRLCPHPPSKRPRSGRSNPSSAATRHRLPNASSLSCGVHVSPPGTRRFAASRGPPASLTCSPPLTAPTVPYGAWLRLPQPLLRTPPPGSGPEPPLRSGATPSLSPRRAAILAPEHPAQL